MKFNINKMCKVKLTALGCNIYNDYYADSKMVRKQPNDELRIELWNLMQIFGRSLYNGATGVPFIDNQIEIEDETDALVENAAYLLNRSKYTVRDMSGEFSGTRGVESLAGSLSLTFMKMEILLEKAGR